MKYLISGATGNIGSLVVEALLARGDRPVVFARDADKARAKFGDRVDVAVGDLGDVPSLTRAFTGVDAGFLVTSGPELDVQDGKAAAVAKTAGVKNLVKLSSMDVAEQVGTGVWHGRGEVAIRASGVPYTFVRPTGFMSNALYWARSIRTDGLLRSSTGDGKIGFVHPSDIAEVSVAALTSNQYIGQTLPLTGPEALSYEQMGSAVGREVGRPVRYETMSDDDARQLQRLWGSPPALIDARIGIFTAIREGRLATLSPEVARVLGRAPIAFARWCVENRAAFL